MKETQKIYLVGYPGSQKIVPASRYLTSKYLPGFDITYLNYTGSIEGWSSYLVDYFSKLHDKYIIFSLDDYLIADYINVDKFLLAKSYIGGDVVCVKLCKSTLEEHKEYPVTTQYCLWNREYLISLLMRVNTPWEMEIQGSRYIIQDKKISILETCINYFTNSSLSARWEGINLTGLKQEDINDMRELLPKESPSIAQAKTVVFGGSGSLGGALIERLISMGRTNILSVSRNESSAVALKEKFPSIQIMIGDISDPWTVKSAMTGADEAIVCAAMKHVGLSELSVNACILTNIVGMMNIINESLQSKPKVLMFISTDKAAQGTGVYGCTKKIGERLMAEAERMNPETKYRVVRYGNVWASNGSIATKWKPKMEKGEEVIITDPEATRFFWPMEEAIDLIFDCIATAKDSTPSVPIMKSVSMQTVLDAMMETYGRSPVKVIGLQPGENKHETTDGVIFSDQCEQFTKDEFKEKFLLEPTTKTGNSSVATTRETPNITAILITKLEKYPEIILERLTASNFFDEILIVNNSANVYNRYLAAKKAANDIIYIQDDDCLVNHQVLFSKYNGQITCAMTKDFIAKYKDTGVCLVGWGAYFDKRMLDVFDKYIAKYGVDAHLLREADRVFTFLNQPHNVIVQPHEDLPQSTDPSRMGYEASHYESMNAALEKCKNL